MRSILLVMLIYEINGEHVIYNKYSSSTIDIINR